MLEKIAQNYEEYYLKPGFIYVTQSPCLISTILGSCVAIALYDKALGYGGMNHYLLANNYDTRQAPSSRYGNCAIELLVDTFLEFGSKLCDLCASIIGGAYLVGHPASKLVAENNLKVADESLAIYGIPVVRREIGGTKGRKLIFDTGTNNIKVILLEKYDFNIKQNDY